MTLPIPLAPLRGTGPGRPQPTALLLLAVTGRPGPAPVSPPGHHAEPIPPRDPSSMWLRNAAAGLGVLAAAAAAVSFTAQYRMAETARHQPAIAALEAAIPDAAALVFASLGIALALHGRRALRARTLNLASVAASVGMNALAAAPGWRDTAIWTLPPVAYALASDTLIGVVRARALARHRHLGTALAADPATPLAALGGLLLWFLRLALAPASTLTGFRAWVLAECPVAPGRLRPGQRHLDRRRPRLGAGSPPAAGRRGGYPAGRARRADLVAAAPGPGPRLHPDWLPRLGPRPVPRQPLAAAG